MVKQRIPNTITEETTQVYNAIAVSYALQAEQNAPQKERDTFISSLPKKSTILDAGCGSGRDCKYFETHGFHVTGIDVSKKLLAIASSQTKNTKYFEYDLRSIPLPDQSFDGIWACASILHIPHSDIPTVLLEFYRLLKLRGSLFILVKAGSGQHYKIEPSTPGIKRFYSFFSKNLLNDLVTRAGFTVEKLYAYNTAHRDKNNRNTWWISCFARK
jgi:ubiquinone/menaquinone biosynthesis C-methylase UbiE